MGQLAYVTANNSCNSGTARILGVISCQQSSFQPGTITGSTLFVRVLPILTVYHQFPDIFLYMTLPSGLERHFINLTSINATAGVNVVGQFRLQQLICVVQVPHGTLGASVTLLQLSQVLYPVQPLFVRDLPIPTAYHLFPELLPIHGHCHPDGAVFNIYINKATVGVKQRDNFVTANNSCEQVPHSTLGVSVTALPAQPGAITGATSVCQGSISNIQYITVSGSTSYTWTLPSGWAAIPLLHQ